MTHTPKWLIRKAVEDRANMPEEVIQYFVTDGYSVKAAKRWLRDLEEVCLIYIRDGRIWPNFPMR